MGDKSAIEWTDATWNPVVGCSTRKANGNAVWTGKVALAPDRTITAPLRWKRPRRIFVNSMGDLFHEAVPDEWIDRVFAVMALCPQHTFQVLTKRSKRMREYCSGGVVARMKKVFLVEFNHNVERMENGERSSGWRLPAGFTDRWIRTTCHLDCIPPCKCYYGADWRPVRADKFDGQKIGGFECHGSGHFDGPVPWPLPNVWLGVSAEDQARADERIPDLLATPAAVRWVSAEPLLGPVDFENVGKIDSLCGFAPDPNGDRHKLDWIVAGGESGPGARPLDPAWARAIRDQCAAAGVAFFMKQMGGPVKARMPIIPDDLLVREFP